jgi:hypothetical protein
MAGALLGNGVINTQRPNAHKATMENVSQWRNIIKALAGNHITISLYGLHYATEELGFLGVVLEGAI